MLKKLLSVSGFTLLSRLSGFGRDILMAAILGASAMMDAFAVALKLPNHFRAIFGEGAFNQAYIPAYSRVRTQAGEAAANLFSIRVHTLVLIVQLVLLALALPFMPVLISWIAPGFVNDPVRFDLAVSLTRITFPYLLFITLVTLLAGNLNAVERFAAAAAAPVLLNVSIIAALAVAFLFPNAAYAAAWGVAIAGVLEYLLLLVAARHAGVAAALARPRMDQDTKQFLKALGPAVLGSAGVQIALFADTIIASLLPAGSYSALYYAERLYQLPIGVIAIAAGTVVLPTMSRLIAQGKVEAAHRAQGKTLAVALLMAGPALAVFISIPDVVLRVLFQRGAFDAAAVDASAAVLAAYAIGLPAVVVIRSIVASFHARGDTTTPVYVSFFAIGCNVLIKLLTWRHLGAPGLAIATAAGAWINAMVLYGLSVQKDWSAPDNTLVKGVLCTLAGTVLMAAFLRGLTGWLDLGQGWTGFGWLCVAGIGGLAIYAVCAIPVIRDLRPKPAPQT
jgi:putative peptidoglycan lipid II flippase